MKRQTHSELHTHFIGMLSFFKLVDLLKDYGYTGFPIDKNCRLDFENPIERTKSLYFSIKDSLYINPKKPMNYFFLDELYYNRRELLKDLADDYIQRNGLSPNDRAEVRRKIHLDFFERALKELIEQEVQYVEVSFSNDSYIKYIMENLSEDIKNQIEVRFMLCTDRANGYAKLEKKVKDIEKSIKNGYSMGFDFMGIEKPFTAIELSPIKTDYGFQEQLRLIIKLLKNYPSSVLRIHAGENKASKHNPLDTLRMVDRVCDEEKIVLPPPELRLGHAIYFDNTKEYLDLLHKYNCIVEVNASSNLALSNITDPSEIDYGYYIDNNVDIVLSTDGGGVYETTLQKENMIAKKNVTRDQYKIIRKTDKNILIKKRGQGGK